MEPWGRGHRDARVCRTCGGKAECKPPKGCTETRHAAHFRARQERNNAYRRERRAQARAAGTVYRMGRGDPETKAERERERHRALREALFAILGEACVQCDFSDKRALVFDHREGGGRAHRRSIGSGSKYLRTLLAMPVEELRRLFQVLCANCNTIKREEREEWRWVNAGTTATDEDEGLPVTA